ncbi:glycosyltransferase [Pseudonocardia sp. NPDC049635]|uniref:glycosyltransferase n=1 Tax=Pseudonocardia sp. NPDC049635 TaxID=3155506 RepID=UPI00340845C5
MRPVEAVGVLVPAHDESETIGACVRSVLTALDAVPGLRVRALCVLADRCSDGTAARARDAIARHPAGARVRHAVLETGPGDPPAPVGAVRARAAATVLTLLGSPGPPGAEAGRTWLLSTDADCTVEPGWVRGHLARADSGADAVIGGVVLDLPGSPVPPGEPPPPDRPVYAANLGVRATAFTAVGGFPAIDCGEDHGIVARLRASGYRVLPGPVDDVRTSARTVGRARGGLADLLARHAGVGGRVAGSPVA